MEENKNETPLYIQAKDYLLGIIRRMEGGANQLEGENLLAAKLGMSRETIRKAMTTLIQEGIITRRHGKGNYGHPSLTNLNMRIDLNSDFRRILTSRGYTVRSFRSGGVVATPSAGMIKRMPEAEGSAVVAFDLDLLADGRPAIHGSVQLLRDIVTRIPQAGEYVDNINEYLKDHCQTESNHTTAWLLAENNAAMARHFSLEPGTALLCWEEIYYDITDRKMGYVKIYFNPEIMDLSLLLKF
ncbi:MAG: hypothetical protein A3J97_11500 [Spirochaetes bacterium RIFOXYC1_FULL_54_7]|nr:MAG: hypothetical protein A3J97_11500 [Spirochaetes bacterium RIFOXYC1_FULL_54_7]